MLLSLHHNSSWICPEGALYVIFIDLYSVTGTYVLWCRYFTAKFQIYQQQSTVVAVTRQQENINELKYNSGSELCAAAAAAS